MSGLTLVVILLFCGLSAAIVAKIKGGLFFLWFAVGFFLPILGTAAALLMRWERYEPHRRCEECGNLVNWSDQVCMRCGRDLEFPDEVLVRRA